MVRRKTGRAGFLRRLSGQAKTQEVILKLVNTTPTSMMVHINLSGAGRITKNAQVIRLASDDLKTENSLDAPMRLAPVEQQSVLKTAVFDQTLPPNRRQSCA